jgi:hypothetical protein
MLNSGWLISLAIALPNLVRVIYPPRLKPVRPASPPGEGTRVMEIVERIGQASVLVIPFFYNLQIESTVDKLLLAVLLGALGLYYAGWVRYIIKGHDLVWYYRSLWSLPLPMNMLPVIYFLSASGLLHSIPLAIASIIFGIGHIYMGQIEYQRLEDNQHG